jgi:pentatricopeptide repeat protein
MKKAQEIFNFLVENKIKLDDVVFNTLCDGYSKAKDVTNALKVLEEMKKSGIKRTTVIYTALIKMYSCLGDERKVQEMFKEMSEEGIKPTIVVYTSLVQVLNRYKKTEEVINIYKQVKADKSLKVDHLLYSFVVNGCCFNKKLEKAIEILMESINDGVKLNEDTYNNVLEYLIANKFMRPHERANSCSMILKALKDRNYQINLDLYNRLMKQIYKPTENHTQNKNVNMKRKK